MPFLFALVASATMTLLPARAFAQTGAFDRLESAAAGETDSVFDGRGRLTAAEPGSGAVLAYDQGTRRTRVPSGAGRDAWALGPPAAPESACGGEPCDGPEARRREFDRLENKYSLIGFLIGLGIGIGAGIVAGLLGGPLAGVLWGWAVAGIGTAIGDGIGSGMASAKVYPEGPP